MAELNYFRTCLTCGRENASDVLRCVCGALLVGLDLTQRSVSSQPEALGAKPEKITELLPSSAPNNAPNSAPVLCAHADCGQENPAGSAHCLYCNRAINVANNGANLANAVNAGKNPKPNDAEHHAPELALVESISPLFQLPKALSERYRITRALPTNGAEADLFLVVPLANAETPNAENFAQGATEYLAKIYRHGIHPKREVLERIAKISRKNRVELFAAGLSDGFTYELMEFCRAGSLRDYLNRLPQHQPDHGSLLVIIDELLQAISDVHQAGLIHRDLKPENILVRTPEPLDLVLTDFGISSLQNNTLRFTGMAHSLAYSAPEALSGVLNGKADWWALGMIILECALGKHPFAGLSDAVILHALSTRSIDLSAIKDASLKKLLAGLLLRDPELRWGKSEIKRWQAGDISLPTPDQEGGQLNPKQAYQIGADRCLNAEQLGVALAKNWCLALSDLDNGLLLKWLREDLNDQNRVRFLINLNLQRDLHVDVRLLRLIIDLAPGAPPVWRGEALSLRSILITADQALKKDSAAIAALDALYVHRVLDAYAAAGNPVMADIAQRWQAALAAFNEAWQLLNKKMSANNANLLSVEDRLYGLDGKQALPRPHTLHARLLASIYDPKWLAHLRSVLAAEVAVLSINCPYLVQTAAIEVFDAAYLLAIESFLPQVRVQSAKISERESSDQEAAQARLVSLQQQTARILRSMSEIGMALPMLLNEEELLNLRNALEQFFGLTNEVRTLNLSSADSLKLRNQVTRCEPLATRMLRLTHQLAEQRTENSAWFNQEALSAAGFGAFFLLRLLSWPLALGLLLLSAMGFSGWRTLPNYFARREIQHLAKRLARIR